MSKTTTAENYKNIMSKLEPYMPGDVIKGRNEWFAKNFIDQPVVFDHPEHGPAAGTIQAGEFLGYLQPGRIPEYTVTIKGLKGGIGDFLLVGNAVTLCDSIKDAINRMKERRLNHVR